MPTPTDPSHAIIALLRERKVATMPQLLEALGHPVERTVFRKLKEVPYRVSYSHVGRYYTLDETARFDANGLWCHGSIRFSSRGTLVATLEAIVRGGPRGFFVDELDDIVGVVTKDALRKLVRDGRVVRKSVEGKFLYCSVDSAVAQRQLGTRAVTPPILGGPLPDQRAGQADLRDDVRGAILLFFNLLDEKMRRLFAGLESLKFGHGGDRGAAALFGLDPGTVARGREQLVSGEIEAGRVRRPGAGRPRLEKKPRNV